MRAQSFFDRRSGSRHLLSQGKGFCVTLSAAKEISRKTGMMNLCMPERVSGGDAKFQGVPSINSIRRRNPGILGVPATALAGCTEVRPVDDEAR